jgi:hypothetical protein
VSPVTSACAWSRSAQAFQCSVKTPKSVHPGKGYTLTAYENVGMGFVVVPGVKTSVDPETIYFRWLSGQDHAGFQILPVADAHVVDDGKSGDHVEDRRLVVRHVLAASTDYQAELSFVVDLVRGDRGDPECVGRPDDAGLLLVEPGLAGWPRLVRLL